MLATPGVARATPTSARRRRERRIRSFVRHEKMAVQMAVVSAQHHSAQRCRSIATQTDDIVPAATCAAAASPAATYAATAASPMVEYADPAPVVTYAAPVCSMLSPVSSLRSVFHQHSPFSSFSTVLSNEFSQLEQRLFGPQGLNRGLGEEACQNCFGILLFCNRTPVEMFALCFLGGFLRLCTLPNLGQVFFPLQRSPFSPDCAAKSVEICSPEVSSFSFLLQQKNFELEFRSNHLFGLYQCVRLCSFHKQGKAPSHPNSCIMTTSRWALFAMRRFGSVSLSTKEQPAPPSDPS